MMTRAERAVALHTAGSSCSQAAFTVFSKDLGIDETLAHRLSTGFGGGIGRKGHVCGAVSGGVLALSMLFGSHVGGEQDKKNKTYEEVARFIDEIEKRHGSSQCRTLLGGADLQTEEGKARVKAEGLGAKVCNPLIVEVVEYIEKVLEREAKHG
jgi:C_GCAxxG_C_C family probable redox protein